MESEDFQLEAGLDPEEQARAEALLSQLAAWEGQRCARCAVALCGHELTVSWAMGFKRAPVCLSCFAQVLERPLAEAREDVHARITRRDCFRQGWLWASAREGFGEDDRPACLWVGGSAAEAPPAPPTSAAPPARADGRWDAGDMSCGDLVLALRGKLGELPPGAVLLLRALDSAAPEDIPAWCRVTRNPLLREEHPLYWIRRKDA
ncbi:MAG: sulfurtransferase TusA family protein [Planctomycetota bacterium]